jgi:hypothetical protein
MEFFLKFSTWFYNYAETLSDDAILRLGGG